VTEDEAHQWIIDRFGVPRETRLQHLAALVIRETEHQNLVSRTSIDSFWCRHIVDSAQLLPLADASGHWLDIGTGAGFPGLVIACLRPAPITLCEPRKRRAAFLESALEALDLTPHARVADTKVESLTERAAVISARAVASLPTLLAAAAKVSDRDTLWLLPKGRSAREEVAEARRTWHGSFHVERSVTQADSSIVVARGVAPK
jgi:16S rRNA (guanine527-N7)-methyltransferase